MSNTPTPRTDASESNAGSSLFGSGLNQRNGYCLRSDMEQLERELAEAKARITALESRLQAAFAERRHEEYSRTSCEKMLAESKAELAELRKDKERLDKIENHARAFGVHLSHRCEAYDVEWDDVYTTLFGRGKTLREAIDAARKEAGDGR